MSNNISEMTKAIFLKTKADSTIVQFATNTKTYVKKYYKREYKEGEEYRSKVVSAPFNIDGIRFDHTADLFDYLVKNKNYKIF